jgi:hypothetical protein
MRNKFANLKHDNYVCIEHQSELNWDIIIMGTDKMFLHIEFGRAASQRIKWWLLIKKLRVQTHMSSREIRGGRNGTKADFSLLLTTPPLLHIDLPSNPALSTAVIRLHNIIMSLHLQVCIYTINITCLLLLDAVSRRGSLLWGDRSPLFYFSFL